MSFIGEELRRLRKATVRANRRLALQDVEGEVVERDAKTWRVRLKIGEDPETGEAIKSPWLRPNSQSNQTSGFKVSPALPSVGSRMRMVSPSGVVGGASYAEPACFDDEEKRPQQDADETVFEFGKSRMAMRDGKMQIAVEGAGGKAMLDFDGDGVTLEIGGKGYRLSADQLQMTTKFIAKNGSRPAVYKNSRDSAGYINVEGNDDVLI